MKNLRLKGKWQKKEQKRTNHLNNYALHRARGRETNTASHTRCSLLRARLTLFIDNF